MSSEQELLILLQQGNQQAFNETYYRFREEFVSWSGKQYSISNEDALDLYQACFMIFFQNLSKNNFEMRSTIKTYLFGIGKNKIRELKRVQYKQIKNKVLFLSDYKDVVIEDWGEKEDLLQLMERGLQMIDEKCRSLLTRYYYQGQSMEEIASDMEYKNSATTKNMKYKCVQKLRKLIAPVQ